MRALEEDPGRYNDKEIIKYIPLDKYLPDNIKKSLGETIKDFDYQKVSFLDSKPVPYCEKVH